MIKEKMQYDDRDWSKMSRLELLYEQEELDAIKLEGELEGERKTVRSVLRKHPDWSDAKIADLLDVPLATVSQVRSE